MVKHHVVKLCPLVRYDMMKEGSMHMSSTQTSPMVFQHMQCSELCDNASYLSSLAGVARAVMGCSVLSRPLMGAGGARGLVPPAPAPLSLPCQAVVMVQLFE